MQAAPGARVADVVDRPGDRADRTEVDRRARGRVDQDVEVGALPPVEEAGGVGQAVGPDGGHGDDPLLVEVGLQVLVEALSHALTPFASVLSAES